MGSIIAGRSASSILSISIHWSTVGIYAPYICNNSLMRYHLFFRYHVTCKYSRHKPVRVTCTHILLAEYALFCLYNLQSSCLSSREQENLSLALPSSPSYYGRSLPLISFANASSTSSLTLLLDPENTPKFLSFEGSTDAHRLRRRC
jgi:hypothetical protein